jgi:hypothetical protein
MQTCLDKYEDNENVMNVHGYGPPIDIPQTYNHDVYFTWRSGSWGQATWKTAWKKFKQDNTLMNRINTNPDFRHKVERAGNDLIPMLHQEINDEVDSVGVWWSLTLIRHEGVSINPVDSKVQNIGIDGTGVHSGSSNHYDVDVDPGADFQGIAFPPCVKVNETLNSRYNRFMTEGIRGRLRRWVNANLRSIF